MDNSLLINQFMKMNSTLHINRIAIIHPRAQVCSISDSVSALSSSTFGMHRIVAFRENVINCIETFLSDPYLNPYWIQKDRIICTYASTCVCRNSTSRHCMRAIWLARVRVSLVASPRCTKYAQEKCILAQVIHTNDGKIFNAFVLSSIVYIHEFAIHKSDYRLYAELSAFVLFK